MIKFVARLIMKLKENKRISRALAKTEDERDKDERKLTPHVVTRFYRAPEVILIDRNYNK